MSYSGQSAGGSVQGAGRVVLASVLLLIGGILNVVWGIAAIGNSHFFTANAHYVFSDLHTWGWITLILGVFELFAAASLWAGNEYGRWFAIVVASLAMMGALFDMPSYPFWSLAVFALSLWILHGLFIYGESAN